MLGPASVDALAGVNRVVHRLDAAVRLDRRRHVARPQRAVLHEHLGDHAAVGFLLGFEAGADRRPVGVRLVFVQLGHGQDRVEQLVDAGALGGAGLDDFDVAAPFAGQQLVGAEARVDPVEVHAGQVDLVERDDDRHFGRAGVADGFFGLRHHAVVGRHHQHGDVGDVGAAGPHLGERFVARRIDERDPPAVLLDRIGADVLRDAAAFAAHHVEADDPVQQRRLAVVDVAQERDHRRTRHEVGRIVDCVLELLDELVFEALRPGEFDVEAEFRDDEFGQLGIDHVGDLGHHVVVQEDPLNLRGLDAGRFGELADGAGELERDVFFARRGGVRAGALLATVEAADGRRHFFAVDRADVAATLQLSLLAPAEHRLAFGGAFLLRPRRGQLCRGSPPASGGRFLGRCPASRGGSCAGGGARFAIAFGIEGRSWRRKWAASGLLPSLPPITSAGSFMSGFCALGSPSAGPPIGLAGVGIGASLIGGARALGARGTIALLASGRLVFGADHRHLAFRAGADVFVAANCRGQWAGRRGVRGSGGLRFGRRGDRRRFGC